MLERLSRHKRNLVLLGLAVVVLWFSWTVRSVLNPLILGYLLAYILSPMVQNLERRGWGRRAAANLIFVSFFALAGAVLLAVVHQGRGLVRDLASTDLVEEVRRNLPTWVGGLLEDGEALIAGEPESSEAGAGGARESAPEPQVNGQVPDEALPAVEPSLREALTETLRELWSEIRTEGPSRELALRQATTVWPYLRSFFGSVMALLTLLFTLPIYAYFLLFELDGIHAFVLRHVPKRERARFERVGTQLGEVLASFFRGRLTICVLKGALITVGLWLCGVPYFAFLGMASGMLSLAPFVGPMLGFVLALLLAVARDGLLLGLLEAGTVFGLAELVEGYVLLPRILGNSLGLHPVVILASVFVGGAALGMFGFLIAVPITAALVIVTREMVLPALRAWADEN